MSKTRLLDQVEHPMTTGFNKSKQHLSLAYKEPSKKNTAIILNYNKHKCIIIQHEAIQVMSLARNVNLRTPSTIDYKKIT